MNNQPDIGFVMHFNFLLISVEYYSIPGVHFMFLAPTFYHRPFNSEADKDFSKHACPLQELEVLGSFRALEIKFTLRHVLTIPRLRAPHLIKIT